MNSPFVLVWEGGPCRACPMRVLVTTSTITKINSASNGKSNVMTVPAKVRNASQLIVRGTGRGRNDPDGFDATERIKRNTQSQPDFRCQHELLGQRIDGILANE
jgi:hypothetical protein